MTIVQHVEGDAVSSLCQDHSVDSPRLLPLSGSSVATCGTRKVLQAPVKLGQLIDRFVTHERLSDENDFVRLIETDQLRITGNK